jgi:hypothetical protein
MVMKNLLLRLLLLALFPMTWSCSDGDDNLKTTGTINAFLVDAPFPTGQVAEANVSIFKVDARLSDPEFEEGIGEGGEGGFVTLMETSENDPINLLDLVNGVSRQLVAAEVPAGTYDLVRVYVDGAEVVMNDENRTTYGLKVPSGAQSGIKIFLDPPLQVAGGLTEDLLLDFDVSRSFVPKGGSAQNADGITGFNFKPVLRGSNLSTTGTVYGQVTTEREAGPEPLPEASVTLLTLEGETAGTTFSDTDGNYMLQGIDAGLYTLEVTLTGFEPFLADGVEVIAANKTEQQAVLLAATQTTGK